MKWLRNVLVGAMALGTATVAAAHPMDSLSPQEIEAAVALLRAAGHLPDGGKIVSLSLDENDKAEVRAWSPGKPYARRAFAVLLDKGKVGEARLDLSAGKVTSFAPVADRQAAVTIDEFLAAGEIVKANAEWRAAVARRGITDLKNVECFPLSVGPSVAPAFRGRRLLNVACAETSGTDNNWWGKPIENVLATVDAANGEVLQLLDRGVLPLPPQTPSHRYENSARSRPQPRPVQIAAPQGHNIVVEDNVVRWDKWSFHVRLEPRLGAVLSLVRFGDGAAARDIAYQVSASEMFVPYMDPAPTWSFRAYMDIGEYGFGALSTPLRPGVDCPAGGVFLDATLADLKGRPVGMKGVVCVFERPTGDPVWRHDEVFNGTFEARPGVELVVRTAPVVGNYDYMLDYVFGRAGDIDVRLGAYGIDATKGVASQTRDAPTGEADTAYGTLVAPRVLAVNHDHYMAFRLDLDVDGTANRLVEDRIVPRRIANEGAAPQPVEGRAQAGRDRGADHHAAQRGAVPGGERDAAQRARLPDLVPAAAGPHRDLNPGARRSDPGPRRLLGLHAVGDAVRGRREVRRRQLSQPEPRARRPAEMDAGQARHRPPGPGAVVRRRLPPRAAGRGLAGDARPVARVPAAARRSTCRRPQRPARWRPCPHRWCRACPRCSPTRCRSRNSAASPRPAGWSG